MISIARRVLCLSVLALATALGAADGQAQSRDVLRIVGSSTVFPFTTAAAENFGARGSHPTPVVEATGTGGGMNLFCAGVGLEHPDITGASRRIKASEYARCQGNGVTGITEIMIGYDGIVIGNSVSAPQTQMDKLELFLALAAQIPMPVDAEGNALFAADGRPLAGASFGAVAGYACETFITNPYSRWAQIDQSLPNAAIEVFGPPPTSGTRDAFIELGMHPGAAALPCMAELQTSDIARFDEIASRLREDGRWVDSGENDNTIVQTLSNSPAAFGVFGYSFLEENTDRIQGTIIDGIAPEYDVIASGEYPISRSLYVYVKNQHDGVVGGLRAFVTELTSEDAWGPFGYLAERGLIALPDAERFEQARQARSLTPMDPTGLH